MTPEVSGKILQGADGLSFWFTKDGNTITSPNREGITANVLACAGAQARTSPRSLAGYFSEWRALSPS